MPVKKRKGGRKARWWKQTPKQIAKRIADDRRSDDFRSVIRGTMSHAEYQAKYEPLLPGTDAYKLAIVQAIATEPSQRTEKQWALIRCEIQLKTVNG